MAVMTSKIKISSSYEFWSKRTKPYPPEQHPGEEIYDPGGQYSYVLVFDGGIYPQYSAEITTDFDNTRTGPDVQDNYIEAEITSVSATYRDTSITENPVDAWNIWSLACLVEPLAGTFNQTHGTYIIGDQHNQMLPYTGDSYWRHSVDQIAHDAFYPNSMATYYNRRILTFGVGNTVSQPRVIREFGLDKWYGTGDSRNDMGHTGNVTVRINGITSSDFDEDGNYKHPLFVESIRFWNNGTDYPDYNSQEIMVESYQNGVSFSAFDYLPGKVYDHSNGGTELWNSCNRLASGGAPDNGTAAVYKSGNWVKTWISINPFKQTDSHGFVYDGTWVIQQQIGDYKDTGGRES